MTEANRKVEDVFETIALLGPALFLGKLVPIDLVETEYLHFTEANARNYLLLRSLTEVQKTGFVAQRARIAASLDTLPNAQMCETRVDEQHLWQRKLLEILVLLINFSTTNYPRYYYHYLLVCELQKYENLLREQMDFFDGESTLTKETVSRLRARIDDATKGNDLADRWFLEARGPKPKRNPYKLASFRRLLLAALPRTTREEKTGIGYTYATGYGEASGNIHFDPCRLEYTDMPGQLEAAGYQCGLLTCAILKRAHALAGVEPEGVNKSVLSSGDKRQGADIPTAGKAVVGDFVLVNGPYLGEVLEIKRSKLGYESYRIRYPAESPLPGIQEDWIPALNLSLFLGRQGVADDAKRLLVTDAGVDPALLEGDTMNEAARKGILEGWKKGFRMYVRRTLQSRKKGERGIGYDA